MLAGVLAAVLYVLLAPNWYQSTLSVVPAKSAHSNPLGALAGGIDLAASVGVDLPGSALTADVDRLAAVLESTSVTDAVIKKFNLLERYDSKYMEQARKDLWSHCSTKILTRATIVQLVCEDKDPAFVKAMLDFFAEHGNEVFHRVGISQAGEEVRFLEGRVADELQKTDEVARRLRDFEEKYKIVDLDAQSKAVVSALASLRGQAISKQLELDYVKSFSARDEATSAQLQQQLAIMDSRFRSLDGTLPTDAAPEPEQKTSARKSSADLFPAAMAVPKLRYEFEQLYRDRRFHESSLLLLMQRLELAKASEARDTSAFQVLDAPTVPTHKSRPHGTLAVLFGLLVGLAAGLGRVYGPAQLERALREK
jgi:capsule polysaccharide export protein KpsE/RkpR